MFGNKLNQVEKAITKKQASTLIRLCEDKDQEVCLAAIVGLGSIGGEHAANYLTSHMQDTDPKVRVAIAQALGELGDIHTKAFVSAKMSTEKDPAVREALSNALGKIKSY